MRIYPAVMPVFVLPTLWLFTQDASRDANMSIAMCGALVATYPSIVLSSLQYSRNWQSAEIFRIAPLAGPSKIMAGARQAVLWVFILPLSLLRCPDGVEGECFFQKHDHGTLPDAVHHLREAKDTVLYVSNLEGLVSLAQINAIELHVWNARVDRLESPDRLIWDLDPAPGVDWTQLVDAALRIRHRLHRLDLESFVKTSGKKGLHVVVPIERRRTWLEAKSFARGVAKQIAREAPDRLTAVSSLRARVGRIFIDFGRNGRGATTVAAYSPRARADAAVSVPVEWDELMRLEGAASLKMTDLAEWLQRRSRDPWKSLLSTRQYLTSAAMREIQQKAERERG